LLDSEQHTLLSSFPFNGQELLRFVVHIELYAILSIPGVLKSSFSQYKRFIKLCCRVSVSLAELLEAETSVSQDLSGNVSGRGDFDTGGDHFEWAPVLVFDQVSNKFV
jgi:hypothetical protein